MTEIDCWEKLYGWTNRLTNEAAFVIGRQWGMRGFYFMAKHLNNHK